jgi:hypothetical protein
MKNHPLVRALLLILWSLIILSMVSCSGGGGNSGDAGDNNGDLNPPPASVAIIKGRVLDTSSMPIPAASIGCQDSAALVWTDENGAFEIEVTPGARKLTISKDNTLALEQCLVVAENVSYDLGDVDTSTPSNCDSICTNGPGSSDRDCDDLPDSLETAGWDVSLTLGDGSTETRQVSSDPNLKDTDGDGLSDVEEYAARTDPSRVDSDGDLLSDYAELAVYKSNPLLVDTDGDSRGPSGEGASDPNLWDGYEIRYSQTSPVLADTDGDGRTDYEEIHSGGTNPLVADLPTLSLELNGDPYIGLKTGISTTCSKTSTSLVREAREHVNTDNVSTKMSIENTVNIHTESKAGTSSWPPSFNASITTDTEFKQGYIHETSSNFTQTSVKEAQDLASCWEEEKVDFSDGQISVAMKLRNKSGLSFKVKNISVIAYQITTGSNFRLIGTLHPDSWDPEGYVLGPYSDMTMTVNKTDIDAAVMKALVADPSALMFEVGGYSLFQLDEWGVNETVNFAKLGESVVQQTGLLTIDYGNGSVERRMIATNVNRNPDGSARGISLQEALGSVLRTAYQSEEQTDGNGNVIGMKVLKKVKTVASYQNDPAREGRGFWIIGGTGEAFAEGITSDFDDIILKNDQRISLVFLKDSDLDGLFDNEEELLGTNPLAEDSDGDGLTDYTEAKVGWTVSVNGTSYQVYPAPRFADVDGDYLSDSAEKVLGTDPYRKNTDGDDLNDTNDPYPLSAPCLSGLELGLAAWWDGSLASAGSSTVKDIWTRAGTGDPLGYASDGVLAGTAPQISWKPSYDTTPSLNSVVNLNPLPTEKDQQITVADDAALDPRRSLSPQTQFSLAGWVYWDGAATGAPWATLLTKGTPGTETYGLYLKADGALALGLYRSYHEKCWYLWWGKWPDDPACADDTHIRREWLETPSYRLPLQTWVHLTATFGDEVMRIYADGVQVAEAVLNNSWESGMYRYQNTTNYLIINNEPLRIGLDLDPAAAQWPYRGMLDDLQLFGGKMSPTEVNLLKEIGVCSP